MSEENAKVQAIVEAMGNIIYAITEPMGDRQEHFYEEIIKQYQQLSLLQLGLVLANVATEMQDLSTGIE